MTDDYKPAYMPWNEDDFSGDLLVSAMTPIQRWMYRTLLQRAFFHSTRPDLPADPEMLWRLAGCESREQWDSNAKPVLAMFKKEDLGDTAVLYQKRLRRDYDTYRDKRDSYADRGKAGATARWGEPAPSSGSEPAKVLQKQLNPLKLLPGICRQLLGVRAEREEYYKQDLKELAETYGGTRVVEAFEKWAKSYSGDARYPIKEFIRVADQYLNDSLKASIHPDIDSLSVDLYNEGQQAFAGKYRHHLNALLASYSATEILSAYKEFISAKDDYQMQRAVRDFCEGGATTIIMAGRKRKEDKAKQDAYMDREAKRMQEEIKNVPVEEEIVEEEL